MLIFVLSYYINLLLSSGSSFVFLLKDRKRMDMDGGRWRETGRGGGDQNQDILYKKKTALSKRGKSPLWSLRR